MKKEYSLKGEYTTVEKNRKYQFKHLESFKKTRVKLSVQKNRKTTCNI